MEPSYNDMERDRRPTLFDAQTTPHHHHQMREFERSMTDTRACEIFLPWRYNIVADWSCVKGFGISPSHDINLDLAQIWLDQKVDQEEKTA